MANTALDGKPYAGNPHVRIDEGDGASAKPRRSSLLYIEERQVPNEVQADVDGAVLFAMGGVMAATNYMDAVNGNDAYNGRAAAAVLSGFAAVNATTILLP